MHSYNRLFFRFAILALAALIHSVPVNAQVPDISVQDLARAEALEDEYGQSGQDEEIDGLPFAPRRPWTFQLRLPVDWRSNLTLAEAEKRSGATIGPDISVSRRWALGRLRIFTEFGSFSNTVLPDAALDTAGIYGTFEIEAGKPSQGLTPYLGYEPFSLYRSRFESHIIALHRFSAGLRRAWGPTFIDGYVRREVATINSAERWGVGTTVSHTLVLSASTVLNLRGEAEYIRHDELDGDRRRDLRTRIRTRVIVELDPAVDLQVTADLRRSWSSAEGFSITSFIIGPTLVARLGF